MTTAKFAAISCVHSPIYNKDSQNWLLNQLEGEDLTHFVFLGDLFDSSAASVHNDSSDHTLLDEYKSASDYLSKIRKILPKKVKLVWILGNHDDNIQANDERRIPSDLRSLVHWNSCKEFSQEFLKWKQIPYIKSKKGCYQLGQIIFYHGFDCGANSDELEGLQMAYACGGSSWRLTVRGHTHRTIDVTQAKRSTKILLPHHYANVGSIGLGHEQPDYMKRKDVILWNAGILFGECKTSKNSRLKSREWDAELVVQQKA
jgi:predicted phosphodiesterase